MAISKYDGGARVKVKLNGGFISYMNEKVAKILQERKELKILGEAEDKKPEEKKAK